MQGSTTILLGGGLLVFVLIVSQIELSLYTPTSAMKQTPRQSRLMLATNDTTSNSMLRQRLANLNQFLSQNSVASAEALALAETRATQLESELKLANKEHADRLMLLEQRLAAYVKAVAASPEVPVAPSLSHIGVSASTSPFESSSPPPPPKYNVPPVDSVPPARGTPTRKRDESTRQPQEATPKKTRTREEMVAAKKAQQEEAKAAALATLQAEVDADVAAFDARGGANFSKRLQLLHVPSGPKIPVLNHDAFGAPARFEGGLRDMYLDKKTKLAVCTIEKVASSELKKLLYRMNRDPKWREEPWFKGNLDKIKFAKSAGRIEDLMNDPEWTKLVFLRHPFDRLVSCYKDKFGRDNRLYSVKLTGNKSTHLLSFEEFLRIITNPGSDQHNPHWRPQSSFCGMKKYLSRFNFVGNFEHLEEHAKFLLRGTDLWDSFGAHGWGTTNSSMFQRNEAAHRTSAGAVEGSIRIDAHKAKQKYDDLLPPGSELRRLAFGYYKKDFEMFAEINIPPFDNTRYKADLLARGG